MNTTYEQHPIGKCYPPLTTEQSQQLQQVLQQSFDTASPVFLYEGKILDGWHWYKTCLESGATPIFEEYKGRDPIGFVIRRHEGRRHLTKGQLAAIGEKLATLQHGSNQFTQRGVEVTSTPHKTRQEIAGELGISARGMDYIRSAKQNGIPELIQATDTGEVAPEKADKISRLPKTEQPAALAKAKSRKGKRGREKGKPNKLNAPRPESIKFPTAEETGFPVNGTMKEKDAHHRKYGRTPLHPKAVKDMLNHSASAGGYVMAILAVTNETQPDAATFFASLEAMMGWVRQPEKGEDWNIDFARKAKEHLRLLRERLPLLVQRTKELQTMVDGPAGLSEKLR